MKSWDTGRFAQASMGMTNRCANPQSEVCCVCTSMVRVTEIPPVVACQESAIVTQRVPEMMRSALASMRVALTCFALL